MIKGYTDHYTNFRSMHCLHYNQICSKCVYLKHIWNFLMSTKNFNPGLKRSYSHEVVCRSTQLLSLPTDRVPRSCLFQTTKMLKLDWSIHLFYDLK